MRMESWAESEKKILSVSKMGKKRTFYRAEQQVARLAQTLFAFSVWVCNGITETRENESRDFDLHNF